MGEDGLGSLWEETEGALLDDAVCSCGSRMPELFCETSAWLVAVCVEMVSAVCESDGFKACEDEFSLFAGNGSASFFETCEAELLRIAFMMTINIYTKLMV